MNLQILINDVDKTDLYLVGTLSLRLRADRKDACSFDILTTAKIGENIFDGDLEVGYIDPTTGVNLANASRHRTRGYVRVEPSMPYMYRDDNTFTDFRVIYYTADLTYISSVWITTGNTTFTETTPATCKYMRFANAATATFSTYYITSDNVVTPTEAYLPYVPKVGMDLKVYDDDELLFGGVIQSCPIKRPAPQDDVFVTVTSDGYADICNRRTVNVVRHNQTTGDIVNYLITEVLTDEGISAGTIEDGVNVATYKASLKNIREILDELADMAGFQWWVDSAKALHFKKNYLTSIENLVSNGSNFVATTGWTAEDEPPTSTTTLSVISSKLDVAIVDAGSLSTYPGTYQNTGETVNAGDVIFFRARIEAPTGAYGPASSGANVKMSVSGGLQDYNFVDENRTILRAISVGGVNDDIVTAYGLGTIPAADDGLSLYVYFNITNFGTHNIRLDEIFAINASDYSIFDNRTADEINSMIPDYFDGTTSPYIESPYEIDEDNGTFTDFRRVRVEENLEMYRNKQWVRGADKPNGSPLLVNSSLTHEQTLRELIEGGSGVYGRVSHFPQVTSKEEATEICTALLAQYGEGGPPIELDFETDTNTFRPNQQLAVLLPTMGINYERAFLIDEVNLYDLDGVNFESRILAYSRDDDDFTTRAYQTGTDFFSSLVRAGQKSEPKKDILNNKIYDHSFELVGTTGAIDATHGDYATTLAAHSAGTQNWMLQGTPRLFSIDASGVDTEEVLFGRQAVVTYGTNLVQQYVPIKAGNTYTLSGHALPHPTRNASSTQVESRLLIYFYTAAFAETSSADRADASLILTTSHTNGEVDNAQRQSLTFTAPATAVWARVFLLSDSASEYVVWDGIQLIPGEDAGLYEPENALFRLKQDGII